MEEDASYMTRQEFMDKHGETVAEIYDELQLKWQYDHAEPESRTMWVDPEDDPLLDSVADKLATLTRQIDDAEWAGNFVNPNIVNEAKRLRELLLEGKLWEPKF